MQKMKLFRVALAQQYVSDRLYHRGLNQFPLARTLSGNSMFDDESFSTLSSVADGKLKNATKSFKFNPDDLVKDYYSSRQDMNFKSGITNTTEVSKNVKAKVRKNIKDKTYQCTNAWSKSWQTPSVKIPGFTSDAVNIFSPRSFCSHPLNVMNESQGPAAIDYCSVLQEDEFHKLADSTIHVLLEKLEEYGDSVDIDGFDIDYGNEVLTLKLGTLGTYVINKQTPNRQIWLSSPVSGPSRYDWDPKTQGWIYRRNRANMFKVLENELEQLCGKPLSLL